MHRYRRISKYPRLPNWIRYPAFALLALGAIIGSCNR